MILIADAGSTKTEWCLMTFSGQNLVITTEGINPITHDIDFIKRSVQHLYSQIGKYLWVGAISDIFFYGAGCTVDGSKLIFSVLGDIFSGTRILVDSDMLGAAKALWQDNRGIACILGTGSNSCKYESGRIVHQIPSLGYILGDEGSACHIGKMLLNSIFKQVLPKDICDLFFQRYGLSLSELYERVYHSTNANTYIAQFAIFCYEHLDDIHIKNLVAGCLNEFIDKDVVPYFSGGDNEGVQIGFIGSVAYYFRGLIEEVCRVRQLSLGRILRAPMEGLIEYHRKYLFPTK